ncbi:MAG: beta-galactosidase [Pseudomonadota bacterium]
MKRTLGVCYYPEHWPAERWAEDARLMREAGLTWVRIGEFAWSRLEPEPGQFAFDWMDNAIDSLGSEGLHVVLGTPSATPPRWMLDRFPDMLPVGPDGQVRGFGSRRHYCFSHAGYRAESAEMAARLGQRYGGNAYVRAWQIDNEFACHDTTLSYSEPALQAFRQWCRDRYQTPDALNRAWGNVFWSMEIRSFDELRLPNGTVTEPNPAHVMAFRRFSSEQVARFNRAQVEALRPHTDAPLIHNYMGREVSFDHFEVGRDLDIASWDSYPIGFLSDRIEASDAHKLAFLRQGDPDVQAFHHDLYRSVGQGRWWVMEQQPGPVNWAPWNPAPLDGMVRLWGWEAFAHGAETVTFFRWRQAPFAQEQMHAGLLRPDAAPAPALTEVAALAREIAEQPEVSAPKATVAILFDYPSAWAWEAQPQGRDFHYFELVLDTYRALRKLGFSIDFVEASGHFDDYALILAPGIATFSAEALARIEMTDAHVIAGPRTNAKTSEMAIPVPLPPALPGLDTLVTRVSSIPPDASVPVVGGGAFCRWFEDLEGDAPSKLTTEDGRPALVETGNLSYVAGWPDAVLWRRILEDAADRTGLTTEQLPDGVRIRDDATHRFVFNYNQQEAFYRGREIPAGGVASWPK